MSHRRSRIRRLCPAVAIPALVVAAALAAVPARASAPGGSGIGVQPVLVGLRNPAAFTIASDGRIFFGEHTTGRIRLHDPASGTTSTFATVSNLSTDGDQGVLGIALHPMYPGRPFVYVYASRLVGGVERNQIVRYTDLGGTGANPRVIFTEDVVANGFHQGGRILFGPDGQLYAVVGDADDPANAQDLSNASGKILRMTPGGGVPAGNPFAGSLVWAFGLRNSFGFAFDPATGGLWEGEDGPECNDELNLVRAGRNYGWGPAETCSTPPAPPANTNQDGPSPVLPLAWFTPNITPVGVAFCDGCGLPGSEGDLFFGAFNNGRIERVVLTADRRHVASVSVVYRTGTPAGVLSMERGPNGTLYFSDTRAIYRLVAA